MKRDWMLIKRYRCGVRMLGEELQICRSTPDGTLLEMSGKYGWEPVKHPVGQDFLNEVNQVMGTQFKERDFLLKKKSEQEKQDICRGV